MTTSLRSFLVLLLAGLAVCASATAANLIHVTTNQDVMDAFDQRCSLREALHNANNNLQFSPVVNECAAGSAVQPDEIVLPFGLYELTRPDNDDDGGDLHVSPTPKGALEPDVRIRGLGDRPIIRQKVANESVLTTFSLSATELENLRLEGGTTPGSGGGIYNIGHLRMRAVTVAANSALYGGGIFTFGGLEMSDGCVVTDNTATADGGGILASPAYGAPLIMRDSQVTLNRAQNGAGISTTGVGVFVDLQRVVMQANQASGNGGGFYGRGSLRIEGARFEGNEAGGTGGAIHHYDEVTIQHGTFIDNQSNQDGGAIHASRLHMSDTRVEGNAAIGRGGALAVFGRLDLERVRLIDNSSGSHGGALMLDNEGIYGSRIVRSEISGNLAAGHGGGLYLLDGGLVVGNTTITGNGANAGGGGLYIGADAMVSAINITLLGHLNGQDLHKYGYLSLGNSIISTPGQPDCLMGLDNPAIVSLGHNIADDASCYGLDQPGDRIDTDPGVGSFDFHNSSARTWSLSLGSPALDAGDDDLGSFQFVGNVDQRGGLRPTGTAFDIGAHEQGATVFDRIFADGFETQ